MATSFGPRASSKKHRARSPGLVARSYHLSKCFLFVFRLAFQVVDICAKCIDDIGDNYILSLIAVQVLFFLAVGDETDLDQYAGHTSCLEYPDALVIPLLYSAADTARIGKLFFDETGEVKALPEII